MCVKDATKKKKSAPVHIAGTRDLEKNIIMEKTLVISDLPSFIDLLPASASAIMVMHVNIRSMKKYWDEF